MIGSLDFVCKDKKNDYCQVSNLTLFLTRLKSFRLPKGLKNTNFLNKNEVYGEGFSMKRGVSWYF